MTTRVLSPSQPSIGNRRIRSGAGLPQDTSAVNDSFQSFDTTERHDDLYKFLHNKLGIPTDDANAYCVSLTGNGYDDISSLRVATEADLIHLGVKIGHVRKMQAAFSSNPMSEKMSAGRMTNLELTLSANENTMNERRFDQRECLDVSLLSEYARQEYRSNTPISREPSVDLSIAEAMIRKQAEKIASLEAKLANVDISENNGDETRSSFPRSSLSRSGSADTQSKPKLTREERLQLHKERKMQENKYKEKVGKWEEPPPLKNKTSPKKKVAENDDLVLKLTSDPSFRKKIEQADRLSKKVSLKSARIEEFRARSPLSPQSSPSANAMERHRNNSSPNFSEGRRTELDRGANVVIYKSGSKSFTGNMDRYRSSYELKRRTLTVKCATCASTKDCEEDIDDPGTYYCKSCWEEYEDDFSIPCEEDAPKQESQQSAVITKSVIHHALWIVHDNPKLGVRNQMECLIETKEPEEKDRVRVIIGVIDFSGNVASSGIEDLRGTENDLGSECIRIRNAKGYYVDYKKVESRVSRDKKIEEFHLGDQNALLLTGKNAALSVAEFLKGCHGAIDVILDPQKEAGGYYPLREVGGRKIAPQFRSKGIGYIRLGDDMGENGLAFLSSNACYSFLSSASCSKISSVKSNTKLVKPTAEDQGGGRASISNATKSTLAPTRKSKPAPQPPEDDSDDESDVESEDEGPTASEILKQLQSPDMYSNMKWKDKADLISQLGHKASKQDGVHVRPQALNLIQDALGGKNVNVHVLRSALIAVGLIGVAMGSDLIKQSSWKTIMIETIKLLKNKQCGSVAKKVLEQLHVHGRCFTVAHSLEYVSHVLGVGFTSSASSGTRNSQATESSQPRKSSTVGGNSIEVIGWLAASIGRERKMESVNPIQERSLLMAFNLFLSFATHREQNCRKNATDGLVECVVYSVEKLEMDMVQAMKMCSSVKKYNPNVWISIQERAKTILRQEQ
ncbi:hypothetical protein ACHAXS_002252 [Conticribra weissflogii]